MVKASVDEITVVMVEALAISLMMQQWEVTSLNFVK